MKDATPKDTATQDTSTQDTATQDAASKRATCVSFFAYFVFIFAITFLGPYHGWKYGLVFSVGLTISLWLIMKFVRVPLAEPPGCPSTISVSHEAEAVEQPRPWSNHRRTEPATERHVT